MPVDTTNVLAVLLELLIKCPVLHIGTYNIIDLKSAVFAPYEHLAPIWAPRMSGDSSTAKFSHFYFVKNMRNIWVISDQAFQFPIPVSFTGYDSFTNKVYALSPEGNLYSYNIVTE